MSALFTLRGWGAGHDLGQPIPVDRGVCIGSVHSTGQRDSKPAYSSVWGWRSLGLVHSAVGEGNLIGEWVEGRGHLPWSSFGIGNEVAGKADSGISII